MKMKMADCLTYWSYTGSDFCRPWSLCSDESAFTDEEDREGTSLLDDLAEAKRCSINVDDVDNDADTVSLWDDVFDEQWTTKDSNSGPTLAELNGGELTDLEHYEPLKIARKRKTSHSSSISSSQHNAQRSLAPVKTVNMNTSESVFKTVTQSGAATGRCINEKVELLCDQQRPVSLEELQDVKPTSLSEPEDTADHGSCLFLQEKRLKTASSLHQAKEDSLEERRTGNSHCKQVSPSILEHSLESGATRLVSKKMKTNSGGKIIIACCQLVMQTHGFCQTDNMRVIVNDYVLSS